jgi:competence protein ComGC
MNPPPPLPTAPKNRTNWMVIGIVCAVVAFFMIAVIGLLAAIAIPNFVKARKAAQRNGCIVNLRTIDGAKSIWALEQHKKTGAAVKESDLVGATEAHPLKQVPVCPAGGFYLINGIGQKPTCSIPGHAL